MGLISLITIVIKILMSSGYDINGWSFDHPFVFQGDGVRVKPVFYQYFSNNIQKLNFVYKPFWCGVRVKLRKVSESFSEYMPTEIVNYRHCSCNHMLKSDNL